MNPIEVVVSSTKLRAKTRATLTITVRNPGPSTCTGITIRFAVPTGLLLVGGSTRISVNQLGVGKSHDHCIALEAERPGRFWVRISNFSYSNPHHRRIVDTGWWLEVLPAPAVPTSSRDARTDPTTRHRGKVFISYRREDAKELADLLYNALRQEFGAEWVFLDREQRELGADFRTRIDTALLASTAMLVLIGPQWNPQLSSQESRRLDFEDDYVRKEIRAGLAAEMRLIPVLFRKAIMPDQTSLPADIRTLAFLDAAEIHTDDVDRAVSQILHALRSHVGQRQRPD